MCAAVQQEEGHQVGLEIFVTCRSDKSTSRTLFRYLVGKTRSQYGGRKNPSLLSSEIGVRFTQAVLSEWNITDVLLISGQEVMLEPQGRRVLSVRTAPENSGCRICIDEM